MSPVASRRHWDIILSFTSADNCDSFIKPISDALKSHDVRIFLDDDVGLFDSGDRNSVQSSLDAIDDSAASIIVISPKYASSYWSLEKLARICDRRRLTVPVFFNVDPRDVRKQGGPFGSFFEDHEAKRSEGDVLRWREAMRVVGGIAGCVFPNTRSSLVLTSQYSCVRYTCTKYWIIS